MTDRLELGWYREMTLVPFWDGCFFIYLALPSLQNLKS
ncbi:hypothetical protein J2X83_004719 [Brevibacillus nitrificans]|nr:hypothetical protein [Brevibacillus nitrificans]